MKIVVTGATSFLGAAVVKTLLDKGHFVYAVIRPNSVNRGVLSSHKENLHIIEQDLQEMDILNQKIPGKCDAFVHLAWGGSGSNSRSQEELQRQNTQAALKALEGARLLHCERFLFSGSQAEYGMCQELMSEELPCCPVSAYGKAKAEVYRLASAQCRQWRQRGIGDMEYIHVRIFSVYGPGDHPWTLVSSCVDAFQKGEHIDLSPCTQLWNFLYIDDLAQAVAKLLTYPGRLRPDGLYNLAAPSSQTRPLKAYVEEIYRLCRGRGSFTYGKKPPNAEGLVGLNPDITRMETEINWHPQVSFAEGIKKVIEASSMHIKH